MIVKSGYENLRRKGRPRLQISPAVPRLDRISTALLEPKVTVVLQTIGPDAPGNAECVNGAIRRCGGNIHSQCGHQVRLGVFELVTVFSVLEAWNEKQSRRLAQILDGFHIVVSVLGRTFYPDPMDVLETWTIDMLIYDVPGALEKTNQVIAEHSGNIRYWFANPWQAPMCSIEYMKISGLVDFPETVDSRQLFVDLDGLAADAGGDVFLEPGLHLNNSSV